MLRSPEGAWKFFGDYKLPVQDKYVATAIAESKPPSVTTSGTVQKPTRIDALPPPQLIEINQKSQRASFYAIQEWEGYVSGIDKDYMYADLIDLVTGESTPGTTAKIPLEEIPESEFKWVALGSIFRWSIGYRRSTAGQKDRVSRIRFRLLKGRSRSEVAVIERRTDELADYFTRFEE